MIQKTTLVLEDTEPPEDENDFGLESIEAEVLEGDDGEAVATQAASASEERVEEVNFNEMGITTLPTGYRPHNFTPNYPSGEFSTFNKSMKQIQASGLDVPYVTLANDGQGVNFSTMRHFAVDEREGYKMLQRFLIDNLCQPVFESLLERADLMLRTPLDAVTLEELKDLSHWQGTRWAWVDPKKDAEAIAINIRNCVTSPSQAIRETGYDPEEVFQQIAADRETFKRLGIEDLFLKLYEQPDAVIVAVNEENN